MHNKSFTADGLATIVGGRNIGDEYFAAGDGIGFLDLDVIAIGAVVPQVAKSFDAYWASQSAYPLDRIVPAATPADLEALAARGRTTLESAEGSSYVESVRQTQFVARVLTGGLEWDWSAAQLVVDDPAKGLDRAQRKDYLMSSLEHVVGPAKREVHLVSPYFVPMKEGVESLAALEARGVQVVVLTNSLEATDVAAVHAGYAKRRRALLEAGVELYELKRSAAPMPVGGAVEPARQDLRRGPRPHLRRLVQLRPALGGAEHRDGSRAALAGARGPSRGRVRAGHPRGLLRGAAGGGRPRPAVDRTRRRARDGTHDRARHDRIPALRRRHDGAAADRLAAVAEGSSP
jgi:hypothetical protein